MKKIKINISVTADIKEDVQQQIEGLEDIESYKANVINYAYEGLNEEIRELLSDDEFENISGEINIEFE